MSGFLNSTIGRKYAMALSAIFLLVFLVVHLALNILSVFSQEAFNAGSYFMGYNKLVQFIMQPLLLIGVIFHFVMGFVLELKNKKARPVKYAVNSPAANSTWMSRNMIISGAVILAFLVLHLYDFWLHEVTFKYVHGNTDLPESTRFWTELNAKFHGNYIHVAIYVVCNILLGLHLAHGFQSSFQSIGARHSKYTPIIKTLGNVYSFIIPLGFIIVAVYHLVSNHSLF